MSGVSHALKGIASTVLLSTVTFAYWCMDTMRALSPYLAIAFVLLHSPAVYAVAVTPPESFVQQNVAKMCGETHLFRVPPLTDANRRRL